MIEQKGLKPDWNESWILENTKIRLTVDERTGCLQSLIHKDSGVNLLNPHKQSVGPIGGIEICEEKASICYSDMEMLSTVSEGLIQNNNLRFLKKFPDSDFDIHVNIRLDDDCLYWAVCLKNRQVELS